MLTALEHERPTLADSTARKEIIDLLFARTDVAAYQWFSQQRGIGGYAKLCQEQPPWQKFKCEQKRQGATCGRCEQFKPFPVDDGLIESHLKGIITLGSYQLAQDGHTVRWAVLDIDDHGEGTEQELQDDALVAYQSLEALGMPASIEASGGSGWRCHLWLFFCAPVAAIRARTILEAALEQAGLAGRPFERFPKQSRTLNGYGNLVKVPFGRHQKTGNWSHFLDPTTLKPIGSVAEALASVRTIDPAAVDATIDLKHLTLNDTPGTEAAPAKDFNYPAAELHKILTRCWWFQEVERQQIADNSTVHYEDWWNYVLMLSRFGNDGVQRILAFSERDERYNEQYTLNMVSYIREHGYHMPSCRRLREGPGQIHCPYQPMDCGAC